jgi:3-hydroxybutyryl-CoA dehydrogenase
MSTSVPELTHAAVVGAGASGRGVARSLAAVGIEVTVLERSRETADRALHSLKEGMERDLGRWGITTSERDAILSRLSWTTDPANVAGSPAIFEAIQEDPKEKRALLRTLHEHADPEAIFLLGTSTLSVSALAESLPLQRRSRVVGLHFQHPVTRVELVELVRGRDTGPEAEAMARELARRLGKEVMEVAEYPGYVTTRLTLVLINEAAHAVMEGVATRDAVDRAMKLRLGATHGPLALADEMGLDSVYRSLNSLWHELGLTQFRPAPLLRRMVNDGWLGEKSGRGFYRYDEAGRRLHEDEDLREPSIDRYFRS